MMQFVNFFVLYDCQLCIFIRLACQSVLTLADTCVQTSVDLALQFNGSKLVARLRCINR